MQTPAWKPLADAYVPVREWLARLEPDVAIVVYNDHGADFMFDQYPTFAIGAADRYGHRRRGFGTRPLPKSEGLAFFNSCFVKVLSRTSSILTVCQELAVEHGFLVPMNLCFEHSKDGWPVAAVPLQVQLSSSTRCHRAALLQARASDSQGRARV